MDTDSVKHKNTREHYWILMDFKHLQTKRVVSFDIKLLRWLGGLAVLIQAGTGKHVGRVNLRFP